jgi:biopolymer transport protein ExbD
VKVKLPGARNNEQAVPSRLIVTLNSKRQIFLGSKKVDLGVLPAELSKIMQKAKEKNLIIRADKSVDIDLVIQVIDAAKGVGINKFTIQTEKETY